MDKKSIDSQSLCVPLTSKVTDSPLSSLNFLIFFARMSGGRIGGQGPAGPRGATDFHPSCIRLPHEETAQPLRPQNSYGDEHTIRSHIHVGQIRQSSSMVIFLLWRRSAHHEANKMATHFPSGLRGAILSANPGKWSPIPWSRAFTPIGLT